ncbi:MAG: hypothetical protein V1723_00565 [Candidatus Uhrbacteria bacterium]
MDAFIVQIVRAFALAFVDVVTFPWWWYSRGLVCVMQWASRSLRGWERAVGLRLWARNLLVPMYGQTDWQGRLISVVMRLAILFGRVLQVIVGALIVVAAVVVYVALPPIAVGGLVMTAFGIR